VVLGGYPPSSTKLREGGYRAFRSTQLRWGTASNPCRGFFLISKEFDQAEDKLTTLPLSNEAEEINKTVFEIINQVKQREDYVFTEDEFNTLMEIAELCPVKYLSPLRVTRMRTLNDQILS
jgi:hypothetical protein